jgi:hypothetical protein
MTTGEILHILIHTTNYNAMRQAFGDYFIAFVRDNLPSDYELIREKEEKYQLDRAELDLNGMQLCKGRVYKALTCQIAINLIKCLNFGISISPCFCIGAVIAS